MPIKREKTASGTRRNPLSGDGGNFMLQALLALSLVIAFMPFLAKKMSGRNHAAEMTAATRQIKSVVPPVKAFTKENLDSLPYGVKIYERRDFSDALESFGLPIGFVPRTPFGQKISLVSAKNDEDVMIFIRISGGNMSAVERAELAMRLGFWAAEPDGTVLRGATGGWEVDAAEFSYKPAAGSIYLRVPLSNEFSELLARNPRNIEDNKMHTDLLMGGRDVKNAEDVFAREGNFKSVQAGDFVLSGIADGRKFNNKFGELKMRRPNFQSKDGANALNVTRGTLAAKSVSAQTVSKYGDLGNLTADVVSVNDFSMSAGHTGFTGPEKWEVRENAILENVTIDAERVEISGFLNATRGQDVYIDTENLIYSSKSGVETDFVSATNLTLRDQTSAGLLNGETGPIILDIRPAGVSVLPDAAVAGINNEAFSIIARPDDNYGALTDCRGVVGSLGVSVVYSHTSLAQNIVCRYVFWQRLERRIDIKKCLLEGKSGC